MPGSDQTALDIDDYVARLGPGITPEDVGKATLDVVTAFDYTAGAYLLTPSGLTPLE